MASTASATGPFIQKERVLIWVSSVSTRRETGAVFRERERKKGERERERKETSKTRNKTPHLSLTHLFGPWGVDDGEAVPVLRLQVDLCRDGRVALAVEEHEEGRRRPRRQRGGAGRGDLGLEPAHAAREGVDRVDRRGSKGVREPAQPPCGRGPVPHRGPAGVGDDASFPRDLALEARLRGLQRGAGAVPLEQQQVDVLVDVDRD